MPDPEDAVVHLRTVLGETDLDREVAAGAGQGTPGAVRDVHRQIHLARRELTVAS